LSSTRYSCPVLIKLEFRNSIPKNNKYKILRKSVQLERVVPCGQTDGRTDMTKPIVAFRKYCERV